MKSFLLLLSLLTFVRGFSFAQENICIGEKHTIYSEVLNEEREYWISYPDNKNDSQNSYPVIYVIDGDSFFYAATTFNRTLSKKRQMPECIIVGILNTDRTRDLTPSKSNGRRDGKTSENDSLIGGSSDVFLKFITQELMPVIDSSFNASGNNIILGHSFGGLFIINTLLKHSQFFNTYIAIDPSLWWDNAKLATESIGITKTKDFSGKSLYFATAKKMRKNNQTIHFESVGLFSSESLPNAEKNHLKLYEKPFEDESHGTIAVPAIYDAFRKLFENQKRP